MIKMLLILIGLVCLCSGAQARLAVAAPQDPDQLVAMVDKPDDGGQPVISFTSGAPLEVLMEAGNGCVLAQSGEAGAGIMGYIRRENLRFGDTAPRIVQPAYYRVEFSKEGPVYAYPDAGAQVIGSCVPGKTY